MAPDSHEETHPLPFFYGGPGVSQTSHPRQIEACTDTISDDAAAARPLQDHTTIPAWFSNNLLQSLRSMCTNHIPAAADKDVVASLASHFAACRTASKRATELSDYRDDLFDQTQAMLVMARTQADMLSHEYMYRKLRLNVIAEIHEQYVANSIAGINCHQNIHCEQRAIGKARCKDRFDDCRADALHIWSPYPDSINSDDARVRFCDLTNRHALDQDASTPLTADDIAHTRYHALEMLLDNKFSHQLYVKMMNDVGKAHDEAAAAAVTLSDMCNMLVTARNKAEFEQQRHENVAICNPSSVNSLDVLLFGNKVSTESASASVRPDEILARLYHVRDQLTAVKMFPSTIEEEYHNLVLRVINVASTAIAAAQADVVAEKQKTAEIETLYRTIVRAGVEAKEATCTRQASLFREAMCRLRIEKETYEHMLAQVLGIDKMRILQAQISPKVNELVEADGGEVQLDNTLKSIGTWYYAKQQLEVRRALEGENKSPPVDAPSSHSLRDQLVHANNEIGLLKHQVTILTHQNNQLKLSDKRTAEVTHNFKIDAARRRAEFDFSQRLDAIVQNHLLEVQDLRDIASSTRNAMCALLRATTGTKSDGNTSLTVPSITELLRQRNEMRRQIYVAFKDRIDSLESQLAVYESGMLLVAPSADSTVHIAPPSTPDVACSIKSVQLARKLRALQDENRELHAQRASFETAALFDAPTPTGYREKKRLRDQRRRYEDKIARLHGAIELLMQIIHRVESKQVTELVNELLDIKSRLTEEEATCANARNTLIQAAVDAETHKYFSMDLLNLARHQKGQVEAQMQDVINMTATSHKRLVRRLEHIIYTPKSRKHMIGELKNALVHTDKGFEDIKKNVSLVRRSMTGVLAQIEDSIVDDPGALTKPKLYQTLQLKSLQLNHERKKAAYYKDMVRRIRVDFAANGTIDSSLKLVINEYVQPDFDDTMPVALELESIPTALETAETLASLYFSMKAENDASRRAIVMSRNMLADTATEAFRQRDVYKHMMLETEHNATAQEKYYVEAFQEMRQCMLNARVAQDLVMQDDKKDMQLPEECVSNPESPDPSVQSCAEEEFSDLDDYEIIPMSVVVAFSDDESDGDNDNDNDNDNDKNSENKSASKHAEESTLQKSTYTSLAVICKLRNLVDVLMTKTENLKQQLSIANAKIVSIDAELKEAVTTSRVYESEAANLAILIMEEQYNVEKAKLSSIAYRHNDAIYSTGGSGGGIYVRSMNEIKDYLDQGFQSLQCNSMLRIRALQRTANKQRVTIDSLQRQLDHERKLSNESRHIYQKQRVQLQALKERVFDTLVSTKNLQENGAQTKIRYRHVGSSYLPHRYSNLTATLIKYFTKVFGNSRVNDIEEDAFSDWYPGIGHENSEALSEVCDSATCHLKHRKAPSNTELSELYRTMNAALQASYNRDVNATTQFLTRAQEIPGSLAASSTSLQFRDRMYSLVETLNTRDDSSRGNLIGLLEQYSRELAFDVYTDMDVEHLFAFETLFKALAETFINERLGMNFGDEESVIDSDSDSDLDSDAGSGPNSNWASDSTSDSDASHNANDVEDWTEDEFFLV